MKTRIIYILITIVITSCLLISCTKSKAVETPAASVSSEAIADAIPRSDEGFRQRDDLDNLRTAINELAAVRDPENRNFEVESRFARFNYFLGIHGSDENENEAAFEKGRDAGKIASKLEPNKPDGYFWYAANLGELSKQSPVTVGLRSVDDIKEAMNKVIELQPGFQGASAYDALAQVELATRINGGKAESAVQYLEKAVSIEDDNSNLHLHLGEAYLAIGKDKEARKQLEHVLSMKPNPDYLPEHRDAVASAKKLLATKF